MLVGVLAAAVALSMVPVSAAGVPVLAAGGVALLVGFRPTADVWGWLGALGIIALWILAITYLFAAIGLAAGSLGNPVREAQTGGDEDGLRGDVAADDSLEVGERRHSARTPASRARRPIRPWSATKAAAA